MKNIFGTTEKLELFNKEGKRVYSFHTNSTGFSYEQTFDSFGNDLTFKSSYGYSWEYTRDSFGNALTYRNSSGFSSEYTRDDKGNELAYKNSLELYEIKGKKVTKEQYEEFINGVKKHTMEELTKLLGYKFKLIK
jgi:hypothetical protein